METFLQVSTHSLNLLHQR